MRLDHRLEGLRLEFGRREVYFPPNRPDRTWGTTSLLCNGYRVSLRRVKRPRRDAGHWTPSNTEVRVGRSKLQLCYFKVLHSWTTGTQGLRNGIKLETQTCSMFRFIVTVLPCLDIIKMYLKDRVCKVVDLRNLLKPIFYSAYHQV